MKFSIHTTFDTEYQKYIFENFVLPEIAIILKKADPLLHVKVEDETESEE